MRGKQQWADHVRDDGFVKNLIILILVIFVVLGIIILYLKDDLELDHFKTSLDIAIGIIIGGYLIKHLEKNGKEK